MQAILEKSFLKLRDMMEPLVSIKTDIANRPKPRHALRMWHRRWWSRFFMDTKLVAYIAALFVVVLLTLGQIFLPII